MNDFDRCSILERLPDLMEKDEPFPNDFAAHLKDCPLCSFWASHSLAIQEIFLSTERNRYVNCPPSEDFHQLLAGATQILRNLYAGMMGSVDRAVSAKAALNFLPASIVRQNPRLLKTKIHLDKCQICEFYYSLIYNKMLELQKIYERRILTGEPLIPKIKKVAAERII